MADIIKPKDYKSAIKPIWCPGCGDFGVLSSITKALAFLKLSREQTAIISGIGCSSRLPAYLDTYGFHGLHGRALPIASGLKAARSELTVIAVGGDGDGYSIGGNHFLHACRRNMDMTYIVMDNRVYGMTKGQPSPTSAPDWPTKLAPHGTGIRPFQPLAIALSSGASFIARGFAGNPSELTRIIVEAINHAGFSFIEVLSPCPTFKPEQKDWKHIVRQWQDEPAEDTATAAGLIHADDGMSTGIVFRAELPPWQPVMEQPVEIAQLEKGFQV